MSDMLTSEPEQHRTVFEQRSLAHSHRQRESRAPSPPFLPPLLEATKRKNKHTGDVCSTRRSQLFKGPFFLFFSFLPGEEAA